MLDPSQLTLIVTTYNWPAALAAVLHALAQQNRLGFDVLIADDGSDAETAALLSGLLPTLPFALRHVWQADLGFRAAAARNRALAQVTRPYVIFLDGDSVPLADFVQGHCALAEPGYFVAGNRVLCSPAGNRALLQPPNTIAALSGKQWLWQRLRGHINRLLPLLRLPDGAWRKRNQDWRGAKTCNLGAWCADLQRINGFDEAYQGWGHEDADLVVRLLRSGVRRKEGRYALPVIHLWHHSHDRSQEAANRQRLAALLSAQHTEARQGLDRYLS